MVPQPINVGHFLEPNLNDVVCCSWWRHQMETFSALLAICAENSPVPGEFPAQRPVTRSFGVFFDLRLNKGLSKQSWGWWLETLSRLLWRHRNVFVQIDNGTGFVKVMTTPDVNQPLWAGWWFWNLEHSRTNSALAFDGNLNILSLYPSHV